MIPLGYCTILEALGMIAREAPDENPDEVLTYLIKDGHLRLFGEEGDESGVHVRRVPGEDLSLWWHAWDTVLATGRLPDFGHDIQLFRYSNKRLLIKEEHLEVLFPSHSFAPAKSGAPGRPTSMHTILLEHKRRRDAGLCEGSQSAGAHALEEWHKNTHPQDPHPSAKTIRNKLPRNFQPCLK